MRIGVLRVHVYVPTCTGVPTSLRRQRRLLDAHRCVGVVLVVDMVHTAAVRALELSPRGARVKLPRHVSSMVGWGAMLYDTFNCSRVFCLFAKHCGVKVVAPGQLMPMVVPFPPTHVQHPVALRGVLMDYQGLSAPPPHRACLCTLMLGTVFGCALTCLCCCA